MTDNEQVKSRNFISEMWKLIMARGIFLTVLGLILLLFPKGTLTTLIFIMGIYWFIDGMVTTFNSIRTKNIYPNWKWTLFSGILGIVAGIIVLAKPFSSAVLTTSFLMWFLGVVAAINGISSLITGIRLQKQHKGERSMIWGGIFSIIFGVILMSSPFTSALAIIKIIGSFALFAGLITLAFAFRVKKKAETQLQN